MNSTLCWNRWKEGKETHVLATKRARDRGCGHEPYPGIEGMGSRSKVLHVDERGDAVGYGLPTGVYAISGRVHHGPYKYPPRASLVATPSNMESWGESYLCGLSLASVECPDPHPTLGADGSF